MQALALPRILSTSAIKHLNDQSAQDVPKKVELILQIIKIEDIPQNPDKKDN
jgi:hypothetical protein